MGDNPLGAAPARRQGVWLKQKTITPLTTLPSTPSSNDLIADRPLPPLLYPTMNRPDCDKDARWWRPVDYPNFYG